jgi:predicted metal-dependent phosphoesterase TrpH
MQLEVDLHVHSQYSYDSMITPEELVLYARRCGLSAVAIVDHDRIDGSLKIAKDADYLIIPGIEISSLEGHILGLNVHELIPSRLGAAETVDKIHENGGVAVACHPVTFFKKSLGRRIDAKFDALEVINASALPFKYSVKHGERLASRLGISRVGGSDAHYGPEIGCAYTLVDSQLGVEEISRAICRGLCQPFGGAIPLTTRLKRELLVIKRKLR